MTAAEVYLVLLLVMLSRALVLFVRQTAIRNLSSHCQSG